jgi:hypothetical protein
MKNNTNISLETALTRFLAALAGKNRSAATIQAYQTDLDQFLDSPASESCVFPRKARSVASGFSDQPRSHATFTQYDGATLVIEGFADLSRDE